MKNRKVSEENVGNKKRSAAGIMFLILLCASVNILFIASVDAKKTEKYMHRYGYYTVSYDGEGDAIVAVKLVLYNSKSSENISEVVLELPSDRIVLYNLVQEYYSDGRHYMEVGEIYDNRDYIGKIYPHRGTVFYPIDYESERTSSSTLLKLKLKKPIIPQGDGTILIMYKIPRDTKIDALGVHKFDFKTIIDKDAALIQNTRVSISVQPGLFIKGLKDEIEYKEDSISLFAGVSEMKVSAEGMKSVDLEDFSRRVTYQRGALVKEAYNLDPYESFHVTGEFSDSWWTLHFGEILLGMTLFALFVFSLRFIFKKKNFKINLDNKKKGGIFDSKNKNYSAVGIRCAVFGFISAAFVSGMWFLLISALNFFGRVLPYYQSNAIIPFVLLLGVIVIAISLFGPGVFVGMRYGVGEGLLSLAFIGFWLLLIIIVIMIFLFFVSYRSVPVYEIGYAVKKSMIG